jgi:hypothetical protein
MFRAIHQHAESPVAGSEVVFNDYVDILFVVYLQELELVLCILQAYKGCLWLVLLYCQLHCSFIQKYYLFELNVL